MEFLRVASFLAGGIGRERPSLGIGNKAEGDFLKGNQFFWGSNSFPANQQASQPEEKNMKNMELVPHGPPVSCWVSETHALQHERLRKDPHTQPSWFVEPCEKLNLWWDISNLSKLPNSTSLRAY